MTDPGHSEPVCQNCGKAFIPRRKNSKFCDREDCEKDRKRKYAKKYYDARDKPKAETVQEEDEMKAGFAAEAPLASSLSADEIVYYPYEIMDGENQGRRLDGPTLGVWLRIGRLPLGTMVKHVKRGMHIVVRKEGRKTAILSKVYQYNSEVKP